MWLYVVGLAVPLVLLPFSLDFLTYTPEGRLFPPLSVVSFAAVLASSWVLSLMGVYRYREVFRHMSYAFAAAVGILALRLAVGTLPSIIVGFPLASIIVGLPLVYTTPTTIDISVLVAVVLTFDFLAAVWGYYMRGAYLRLFHISGVRQFRQAASATWIGVWIFILMTSVGPPVELVRLIQLAAGATPILAGHLLAIAAATRFLRRPPQLQTDV